MSIFSARFNAIVSTAIKAFAKKSLVKPEDAQLMFCLLKQDDGTFKDGYKMCLHYKPKEDYTIKQVLGVKHLDIFNFSNMLPPHIKNILMAQCEENSIDPLKITALATLSSDIVSLHIYNGNDYVKTVEVDELLSIQTA